MELPQERGEREPVAPTTPTGNVAVADEALKRNPVTFLHLSAEANQGNLLLAWANGSFVAFRTILAAEIPHDSDARVKVIGRSLPRIVPAATSMLPWARIK